MKKEHKILIGIAVFLGLAAIGAALYFHNKKKDGKHKDAPAGKSDVAAPNATAENNPDLKQSFVMAPSAANPGGN